MTIISNKLTSHVVVGVGKASDLRTYLPATLDSHLVNQAILQAKQTAFTGKLGEAVTLHLAKDKGFITLILVGVCGHTGTVNAFRELGAFVADYCKNFKPEAVSFCIHGVISTDLSDEMQTTQFLFGFSQAVYNLENDQNVHINLPMPKEVHILGGSKTLVNFLQNNLLPILKGSEFSRMLANTPPNLMMPEHFLKHCKDELEPLGVTVSCLDHNDLESEQMNLLLAVGKGSVHKPKLIVLEWKNNKKSNPIALVGKGLMFDSGGYCVKPGAGQYSMKLDMTGAASIAGAMKTIALQNIDLPIVAVIAAAENSIHSDAYCPDDILHAHSGHTVEIIDTDAEGRLALADALSYTVKYFDPRCIIDAATLTYAAIVIMGSYYIPFCSNNDQLAADLEEAGRISGDLAWRAPFAPQEYLESHIADLKNVGKVFYPHVKGSSGHACGSGIGATFLQNFIPEDTPWAHLDLIGASVEWKNGSLRAYRHSHSGENVALLVTYLQGVATKE
ncbi:MAG: leucyl aminopeptidase family protein [Alphaproteobacteria bacterium]|nr:leucyl aminopeptidase family protein [Alphaproteobacteria bacterium]